MSGDDSDFDYLIKIVIIGDSGVGKTNFLSRFVEGDFSPNHEATIGFDYKTKICLLPRSQKKVKFQMWDTAGQEKYMSINRNLFQRVNGIILMYDIAEQKSFDNLRQWINIIDQFVKGLPIILVGNKKDLDDLRAVPKEKGEQLANYHNISFWESSSKSGENVEECFLDFGEQIIAYNFSEDSKSGGSSIVISNNSSNNTKKKKNKCC
jgi:Ras-related protein Rab-8A